MKLQSLVVVAVRLMALDFMLEAVTQLTPQILRLLPLYGRSPFSGAGPFLELLRIPGGLIAVAVLLWLFALPIARLVTRGVPGDLSFGAMSLRDCYSIVFIGLGLFCITRYLPQLLNWAHYFLKTAASGRRDVGYSVSGYDVSRAVIPFIMGVILFVKGRAWAVVLARRQEKAETPNQSVEPTGARHSS
jgi:hypothetical protein